MRLFIAADLSNRQKKMLTSLQSELKSSFNNVKWVETSGLHITLKFLGETEKQENEIANLLKQAVKAFSSFELSLKGLGCFPNHRRPRIIWVGTELGKDNLKELSKQINLKLGELFAPEKKPFFPHVTLGRIRNPEKLSAEKIINNYRDFYIPPTRISYINLYRSVLSSRGATYTSLQKINF